MFQVHLCSCNVVMIILAVVLSHIVFYVNGEYSVKCNNGSNTGTSFQPSTDGIKGRYTVEWCTVANANATEWNLVISYNMYKNKNNCAKAAVGRKHSEIMAQFGHQDVNCSDVCFSTQLDLIFSGCYIIDNRLPSISAKTYKTNYYISNEFTKESFTDTIINADVIPHDKYVSVHWNLGNITATLYDMDLCKVQNLSTHESVKDKECQNINSNCINTSDRNKNEIVCRLWQLDGQYRIQLTHLAPWKNSGIFSEQQSSHYTFEVSGGERARVVPPSGGSARAAWAACGALAAAACAAWAAWRCRGAARFRKAVLDDWRRRAAGESVGECGGGGGVGKGGGGPVVVVRAGDAAGVGAALADLLQLAAPAQVYDLQSPQVVAASAAAPGAWLRALLAAPRARLLLLQTPALKAARSGGAVDAGGVPNAGATLLPLALRLLAESDLHTRFPYTKYYLVTVSGAETEVAAHAVPFQRHTLPRHARRLLLELGALRAAAAAADTGPLAAACRRLAAAAAPTAPTAPLL